MDILLGLVEKAPYAAFSGYLIWVIVRQSRSVLEAFREGAESQKDLAEALKVLRKMEDSNRELALKISELRAEIARLT